MSLKSRYTLFLIAAMTLGMQSQQAFAQSGEGVDDKTPAPIVFLVLDTSGSMNQSFGDPAQNNTRLTKALGEIIGESTNREGDKLVRADRALNHPNGQETFSMPYPVWNTTTKKYSYVNKSIYMNSQIAIPKNNTSGMGNDTLNKDNNYKALDGDYANNGIIQDYIDRVKFGMAGMAVGSAGSGDGTDSVFKAAVEAAGGSTDGAVLRFTLIWGHKQNQCSYTDLDSHVYIYPPGSSTWSNHIYYSTPQGKLDVDNLSPASRSDTVQYTVCVDKTTQAYYECLNDKTSADKAKRMRCTNISSDMKVGVENVRWMESDLNSIEDKTTFVYKIRTYETRDNSSKECDYDDNDFTIEIAFRDKNGCITSSTYDYTQRLANHTDYTIATVMYHKDTETFELLGNSVNGNLEDTSKDVVKGAPDYIYGYPKNANKKYKNYGLDLSNEEYKRGKDCTFDTGMWSSHENASAPLFYPSANDDQIAESNNALIRAARTYVATAATPIGPVLADLYFMFGGKGYNSSEPSKSDTFSQADPMLTKNVGIENSAGAEIVDTVYNCRKKSVIFISDGTPEGGGVFDETTASGEIVGDPDKHGHQQAVWLDAWHLSKSDIKVYVVGYAEFDGLDPAKETIEVKVTNSDGTIETQTKPNPAHVLNMMAWKGGTCRNPVTNELLDPNKDQDYENLLKNSSVKDRTCFYNAKDSTALRKAIVNALSDTLSDTRSRTKIATTTAIGTVKNTKPNPDTSLDEYTNGYYNVYSGYKITFGSIYQSQLNRETYTCDKEEGEFTHDDTQYLDLTSRLRCRLTETGVTDCATSTPCATSSLSADDRTATNTCIDHRNIFTGDYSENRYQVAPKNISLRHANAGIVKDAKGDGTETSTLNFLKNSNTSVTCANEYSKTLGQFVTSANYILSPYNCVTDFDCASNDGPQLVCDLGRCVNPDLYKLTPCTGNSGSSLCIDGYLRSKGVECNTHNDCNPAETGKVCHAGSCMPGTVIGCDMRHFIATQPLGAIDYATPVIVNPPNRPLGGLYKTFAQKYWNRDTLLMVGANDGMLHAFVLGDNNKNPATSRYVVGEDKYQFHVSDNADDKKGSIVPNKLLVDQVKEGDEIWGFIPKTVLPNLHKLTNFGMQNHVNATPVVADVLKPAASETETAEFRTVIVGGLRTGGRGYYALDITDPAKPEILWEIDHQWRLPKGSAAVELSMLDPTNEIKENELETKTDYPFIQLGWTYAEPLITKVLIDGVAEPVAILPGGQPQSGDDTNKNTSSVSSPNAVGKTLYIVRLFPKNEDGSDLLVKTFHFKNTVTGAPSVYPNNFNATAQHIYVGDSKGAIYRLNVSDPTNPKNSPDNWGDHDGDGHEIPVFEPEKLEVMGKLPYDKITHRPAVALYKQQNGRPIIMVSVGTGSNDRFHVNVTENDTTSDHNYIATFFDVPDNMGKYTFGDGALGIKSSVYVFNPPKALKPTDPSKSSTDQKLNVYISDPRVKEGTSPFDKRQKMTGAPIIYNYSAYFPTFIASEDSANVCAVGHAAIYQMLPPDKTQQYAVLSGNVQNNDKKVNKDDTEVPFESKSIYELPAGTKIYGLEITDQMYCAGKNGKFAAPQLVAQIGGSSKGSNTADAETNKLSQKSADNNIQSFNLNLDGIQAEPKSIKWASVYE